MYRCAGAEVWRTNIQNSICFSAICLYNAENCIFTNYYYRHNILFLPDFCIFHLFFSILRSCQSRTEILKTLHRKKFCACTCTMNKREAKSILFCQARLPLCKNVFTQRTFAFKKGSCVPPCNALTGIDFWLLQILTANNKRRTV